MNRRKFLGTVAMGAGFTAFPIWLSRSFGLTRETCPEPATALEPAPAPELSDPHHCGPTGANYKPTLVLVIPADERLQWDRGSAFGELLNHGSDAQLAALACFEVVCSRVDALDPAVREQVVGEPLMLALDPGAAPQVLALDAPVPAHHEASDALRWGGTVEERLDVDRKTEAQIDARIAMVAELIASAADGARLIDQACRERGGLPRGDLARLDELPASLGELGPHDVDRAPALALLAAREGDAAQREHLTALLAAAVRTRLCDSPIPGAPWARTHGCGITVEGATRQSRVACGMGSVPARSTRFLKFYTASWE